MNEGMIFEGCRNPRSIDRYISGYADAKLELIIDYIENRIETLEKDRKGFSLSEFDRNDYNSRMDELMKLKGFIKAKQSQ
jgi:hypothetical protein